MPLESNYKIHFFRDTYSLVILHVDHTEVLFLFFSINKRKFIENAPQNSIYITINTLVKIEVFNTAMTSYTQGILLNSSSTIMYHNYWSVHLIENIWLMLIKPKNIDELEPFLVEEFKNTQNNVVKKDVCLLFLLKVKE